MKGTMWSDSSLISVIVGHEKEEKGQGFIQDFLWGEKLPIIRPESF